MKVSQIPLTILGPAGGLDSVLTLDWREAELWLHCQQGDEEYVWPILNGLHYWQAEQEIPLALSWTVNGWLIDIARPYHQGKISIGAAVARNPMLTSTKKGVW